SRHCWILLKKPSTFGFVFIFIPLFVKCEPRWSIQCPVTDGGNRMPQEKIAIKTSDGTASCHLIAPDGEGQWPAVIMYMDAFGVRPALVDMAARLSSHGYVVLLPDLYYRAEGHPVFDPKTAFSGPDRDKIGALYQSLNPPLIAQDT